MINEKSFFHRFANAIDIWLLASLFALVLIGGFAVYSASFNYGISSKYVTVQTAAFFLGIVLMLFTAGFNYQYYRQLDKAVYIFSILLLVSVLIFGVTINGAKRWINFGFFSFQPVEIAKLAYILVISSFLDKNWKNIKKPSALAYTFAILMGHFILIMAQPAFSSILPYFLVTLVLLYVAGAERFYLLCISLFCGLSVGIPLLIEFLKLQPFVANPSSYIGYFINSLQSNVIGIFYVAVVIVALIFVIWWLLWKFRVKISIIYAVLLGFAVMFGFMASMSVEKSLKDYQRKRMVVFLYPETDSRGAGYNVIQSKIAMGSGKISGKGFLKGTQTQLGFLPEQHTDFIFSVIGEEGGWFFSQLVILLYFIFIWRALIIARESRDRYGSLVAMGIAAMFVFYAVINISMVTGLMPVAGVPLLFLSYGGSSMVSSMIAVGLLFSIHMRRYTYY
ncbi:MAG: rod shape-determining protein RodA [Endomicrobia bacterium]|nr:rod shape-determining protein RodA [Endomicrobiia bacterium]MCL2507010.1 rod shape-determining protein RodA [Endomicrobiia bacterium]